MTVNLSALAGAGQQFFDNSGIPLSGGKLYSYAAGTTTPQATYTSVTGLTAHTNPIVLNSAGRVATGEIWVTAGQNYKFVLETSTNVMLVTWDNITGINGTGIATNANLVEYDPPFTGAVTSGYNVEEKLSQTVSVKDFGAVGDGVTDDTAAINAALAASNSVFIPSGLYKVTTINLNQSTGINSTGGNLIYGAGTDDAGTQLIGTAGYTMFKAWGDAPPAFRALVAADITGLTFSAPVTKTADFSVAASDLWLINNKSGSTCTVTLPTASSYSGRILHFQNYQVQALVSASSNVVPIAGGAAGTSILVASSGDQATLVSDGTNWLMTQYIPNNILLLET